MKALSFLVLGMCFCALAQARIFIDCVDASGRHPEPMRIEVHKDGGTFFALIYDKHSSLPHHYPVIIDHGDMDQIHALHFAGYTLYAQKGGGFWNYEPQGNREGNGYQLSCTTAF